MHKVVYNACYGGFSLSDEAVKWLMENGSKETRDFLKKESTTPHEIFGGRIEEPNLSRAGYEWEGTIPRHHKDLVAVVEALGYKAGGKFTELCIYELSGNQYRIDEYDGFETVYEPSTEEWITIEEE